MIPAKKSWWADLVFRPYVYGLMKRNFASINLLGKLPEIEPEYPLLLVPNHSTWWDGFFVYLLNNRVFHREPYLMMSEEQLRRYPFFARLGVYSVAQKNVISSLKYSVRILESDQNIMLCIFPQGELTLWDARPLNYKRGVEWILSQYGERVNLLPLAIKTAFTDQKKPETFLLFDQNYVFDQVIFPGMDWLEGRETDLLEDLHERILHKEREQVLLQNKMPKKNTPRIEKVDSPAVIVGKQ